MNYITITTEKAETYSSISNYFIDYYMPSANGDFVKIYLYLVRLLSTKEPVSIPDIADHLGLSEGFICKGIRYWIGQDVLRLNYNNKNVLTGITMLPLRDKSMDEDNLNSLSMLGMDFSAVAPDTSAVSNAQEEPAEPAQIQEVQTVQDYHPIFHEPPAKAAITPELLRKKQDDDIFSDILFEAEAFYGKTLSLNETEILIYIYDQLHFSQELIEYLIDYCLTRNKTNLKYAEGVAKGWYKNGIDTVEKAKESSMSFNPLVKLIFPELGISRSIPTNTELAYIDAWSEEMGFSDELIVLACKKAILSRPQSANFAYVNGILENWHKKGVKSIKDVESLDQEHLKNMAARDIQTYRATAKPNGFANFQQTDMSDQLGELEQLLADSLNKNDKIS